MLDLVKYNKMGHVSSKKPKGVNCLGKKTCFSCSNKSIIRAISLTKGIRTRGLA